MPVSEYVNLTVSDLGELDRKTTVFSIPVSPIEAHGPHLPLGTDVVVAAAIRDRVQASMLEKRPELFFVNLPPLYCGSDALPYPGSLSVNAMSLSGVLYDYAKGLVKQGFRYLVIFDNHGGPRHHLGIAHASEKAWKNHRFYVIDPFIEIYRSMVTHDPEFLALTGLEPGRCGDDADSHAGTNETSLMMAISEDYASRDYNGVPPSVPPKMRGAAKAVDFLGALVGRLGGKRTGPDLKHLSQALAWTGEKGFMPYMGSPGLASKEAGEAMLGAHARISAGLIEKALSGSEVRPIPMLSRLSFLRRLPE